ncbi:hypothetical protein [Collinsella sp. An2]|nr:hypothetical protein [Collinsella sp. An2]
MDAMTDGRPWHWAVATALTVALLLPLLPVAAVAIMRDKMRRGAWNR